MTELARYLFTISAFRAPFPITIAMRPGDLHTIGYGKYAVKLNCEEVPAVCPYCYKFVDEAGCPAVDDNGVKIHRLRSPWEG
jgi:hypothetical protein